MPKPKEAAGNLNRVPLGSLCLFEPDYGISAAAIERTDESQPKYIRITDFSDNGIADGHIFTTTAKYLPKHILNDGDILFARSGSIGRTYQYDKSLGLAVFAGYCIRFAIDPQKAVPEYVYWYTKTQLYDDWVQKIKRPTVQPNINKEEYKTLEIVLPARDKQLQLVKRMAFASQQRAAKLRKADELLAGIDGLIFEKLGVTLQPLSPALSYAVRRGDILDTEIYCRPTYPRYLRTVHSLRSSRFCKGTLEKYVSVNPYTDCSGLHDSHNVSFVPMSAVGNKDNTVSYDERAYESVKTGYTVFGRGDLLWAKITPCMQNGKSCLTADMPTQIGFGSTEFHVLRKASDEIHMPFLWVVLSNNTILQAAQAVFNGSAGHQRVSDSFLKHLPLPLPDMKTQINIADTAFETLDKVSALRNKAETEWMEAKALFERELMSGF